MSQITKERDPMKMLVSDRDNGTADVDRGVKECEEGCRFKSALLTGWKRVLQPASLPAQGAEGSDRQAAFWDDRATRYDEDIQRHDSLYERTIRSTTSLLSDSDEVLDFGCGSGEISLDIAPHVRWVCAIDTSEVMIRLADQKIRDRQIGNASFSQTEIFAPEFEGRSFSAVTAFNIFHLLDNVPRALARLHELVKPGGLLISQTPCLTERNWVVRTLVGLAQKAGFAPPIRSLTFAELESLVARSGFEIVDSEIWDAKDAIQRVVARKPGANR